jgi:hypothetical protein
MDTSCFLDFEFKCIMRERKYYSLLSLCEVISGNISRIMEKIEQYLLHEQNCFFVGSDFEYFLQLAKSASIKASSQTDRDCLWVSIEVLLHLITAVKKGGRGRKEYLLTGKSAIELRNEILHRIVVLKETAGILLEIMFRILFTNLFL